MNITHKIKDTSKSYKYEVRDLIEKIKSGDISAEDTLTNVYIPLLLRKAAMMAKSEIAHKMVNGAMVNGVELTAYKGDNITVAGSETNIIYNMKVKFQPERNVSILSDEKFISHEALRLFDFLIDNVPSLIWKKLVAHINAWERQKV